MSDLSHVDITQPFMPRDEDPDNVVYKRKAQRAGVPRAAKESDIEARLYALNRRAIVDWQEGRC